jgi:hypothetical protein
MSSILLVVVGRGGGVVGTHPDGAMQIELSSSPFLHITICHFLYLYLKQGSFLFFLSSNFCVITRNSEMKGKWTLLTSPVWKCKCIAYNIGYYTHAMLSMEPMWHLNGHAACGLGVQVCRYW